MRFAETAISGAFTIALDAAEDERGFFARTFCDDEFARAGVPMRPRQINVSHNAAAFTLRGMHYQAAPHAETKIVQCARGRIFDVTIDLRPGSATYRCWFGVELGPDARSMVFIPEGCAHGFLTLEKDTDVFYVMSASHVPEAGRGVRWNDPAFGVEWPAQPRVMSLRDRAYPDFKP